MTRADSVPLAPRVQSPPLSRLSVVIPARDEEGCIASTVEKLYVELRLHNIPHEVVVVDDGSTDNTWNILLETRERVPTLHPVKNEGLHGFGRALITGFDSVSGDAIVVMMADESDDSRDAKRGSQTPERNTEVTNGSSP